MRPRRIAVVAAAAIGVPYALGAGLLLRHVASGKPGIFEFWRECLLTAAAYSVVGVFVLARRPGHRIGVLFATLGTVSAVQLLSGEYSEYVQHVSHRLPWGQPASDLSTMAQTVLACGLLRLMQVFPEAPLVGRTWRLVTACTAIGMISAMTDVVLDLPGLGVLQLAALTAAATGSLAAIVVRWRRSRGVERAQVKWMALAAIAGFTLIVTGALGVWSWPVAGIALPIGAGVAILRHRLYDIDRVVSRTVSYAVLTALLAAPYVAVVTGASRVGGSNQLAVALATLAAAAAFNPLRRRVQDGVDRRFNRARYDAGRTLEAFTQRLREEIDLQTVRADLLAVVAQTVQPSSASLWLRGGS